MFHFHLAARDSSVSASHVLRFRQNVASFGIHSMGLHRFIGGQFANGLY